MTKTPSRRLGRSTLLVWTNSNSEDNCSTSEQLTSFAMYQPTGGLILSMSALGALFCLTPLFLLKSAHLYMPNDENSLFIEMAIMGSSTSQFAAFFVAILPAADLLLDIPAMIATLIFPDDKGPKKLADSKVVRLTEVERLLFIIGIFLHSCASFMPSSTEFAQRRLVYKCTNLASILLLLVPIVVFLERTTLTFTPWRTFFITFVATMSFVLTTLAIFFFSDLEVTNNLSKAGFALSTMSGLMYLLLIGVCFVKFINEKVGTVEARQMFYLSIMKYIKRPLLAIKPVEMTADLRSQLYTHCIPALHMISSLVISIALFAASYSPLRDLAHAYERKDYVVLAGEIIVLVIELRIRKNEVARGLVRNENI